jgi:hypothetical protein
MLSASEGLGSLKIYRPGRRRPKRLGEEVRAGIIVATLSQPLGGHPHWSSRPVASGVEVSATTVLDS